MKNSKLPLWSDDKDADEILDNINQGEYSTFDYEGIIFNLFEDIQCLKEDLLEFNDPKNWTRPYTNEGVLFNKHALYLPKIKIGDQKMVYGLRNATPEFIESLKKKHRQGVHITHRLDGTKLPYNGCFHTKVGETLKSWADLERNK